MTPLGKSLMVSGVSGGVLSLLQKGRGGFFAFLAPAILSPLTADAADRRVWYGPAPSSIVIGPPTVDHATATVTFINTTVHNGSEAFSLDWEGIEVHVHFEWNAGAVGSERVTVTPPDGYMAIPDTIMVPEDQTDTIQIVKFEGM